MLFYIPKFVFVYIIPLSKFLLLKISLMLSLAQASVIPFLSFGAVNSTRQRCPTVSSARCSHASFYNFPHPKFKQTHIN